MNDIDETRKEKFILDAGCGGRQFWFDKNHPNTLYIDNRIAEKGHWSRRPNHEVKPDIVMDTRRMDFPDRRFKLIIWDPPQIFFSENSELKKKYGALDKKTWREDLKLSFEECWRVLEDYGVLIFKWNESCVSTKEVLSLFDQQPLFGHPSGSKSKTKWMCFMKIPGAEKQTQLKVEL